MDAFPELVRQFTIPLARKKQWRSFCEIGSLRGDSANVLLGMDGVSLTIIDPCLDVDLVYRYSTDPRVTVHRAISLDALPLVKGPFDCILIDGDHNWYTVYNELRLIRERDLLRRGGIIFFHDVSWPYGRRDMYYQPELIPSAHRHPYECKAIVAGKSELVDREASDAAIHNATEEGGRRNGVLTAIEDFMKEHNGDYYFWRVRRLNGMGILQYRRRTLRDGLSFIALVGKAVRYDSQAIFGRLPKSLLSRRAVAGNKRVSNS
jgi:predicted O-methyltransferase YrrM